MMRQWCVRALCAVCVRALRCCWCCWCSASPRPHMPVLALMQRRACAYLQMKRARLDTFFVQPVPMCLPLPHLCFYPKSANMGWAGLDPFTPM
jgi:hypothetical protein